MDCIIDAVQDSVLATLQHEFLTLNEDSIAGVTDQIQPSLEKTVQNRVRYWLDERRHEPALASTESPIISQVCLLQSYQDTKPVQTV